MLCALGVAVRKRAKVDGNHAAIVDAWRKAGASVLSLAPLGHGAPDALVCWRPAAKIDNWVPDFELALFEIKDGSRKPSGQRLTEDEAAFHAKWPGKIHIVRSVTEALDLIK